jgi:hypothetical protein
MQQGTSIALLFGSAAPAITALAAVVEPGGVFIVADIFVQLLVMLGAALALVAIHRFTAWFHRDSKWNNLHTNR